MARMLLISWKDKRSGWGRRARWYAAGPEQIGVDIRLCFEDENGKMNHYPKTEEIAQEWWDAFKTGEINAFGKATKV